MRLFEILDKKIKNFDVHEEENDYGGHVLMITAKIGDRNVQFHGESILDENKKSSWEISFTEEYEKGRHTYELTGSGNEFEVFSFIKQCMEILINKHHPDKISFTADKSKDEGRGRLYEKMLRKNLKGYSLKITHNGSDVVFKMEKL